MPMRPERACGLDMAVDPVRDVIPVILAGGSGQRLWPLSRSARPKPFLKLFGKPSFFQQAVMRASGCQPPVVVCSRAHYDTAQYQMKELAVIPQQIFLEPEGRGTAAAVAVAAHYFAAGGRRDALLLVLPSDHVITRQDVFRDAVGNAAGWARQGKIAFMGIEPRRADPGFGYVYKANEVGPDVFEVARFVEKPDAKAAAGYLCDEKWLWNSGIFLLSADTFLKNLKDRDAGLWETTLQAVNKAARRQNAVLLNEAVFGNCAAASIDEILANADGRVVMKADIGWHDIGTWPRLIRSFLPRLPM